MCVGLPLIYQDKLCVLVSVSVIVSLCYIMDYFTIDRRGLIIIILLLKEIGNARLGESD